VPVVAPPAVEGREQEITGARQAEAPEPPHATIRSRRVQLAVRQSSSGFSVENTFFSRKFGFSEKKRVEPAQPELFW